MITKRNSSLFVALSLGVAALTGCGGNDEDDDVGTNANVVEIAASPSTLVAGEASIISTKFSFSSSDVFDENDDIEVVVELPPQLLFRPGTAEIKRPIDDMDINPAAEVQCPGGTSFLRFSLGRSDLVDANNPGGDADAELRFTVDSLPPTGATLIAAAASDDTVPFSCASGVPAQATGSITLLP